jgi:hypothetical protein
VQTREERIARRTQWPLLVAALLTIPAIVMGQTLRLLSELAVGGDWLDEQLKLRTRGREHFKLARPSMSRRRG